MKKFIFALLIITMSLFSCACGSNQENIDKKETTTINKEEISKLSVGETASTDMFECTLTNAEFSPILSNIMNEEYLLPVSSSNIDNPYIADKDSVFLSFVFKLSYLGTEEFDFELGKSESADLDWMNFCVKYDNTYEFSSFSITGSLDGTWDSPHDISGGYMTKLSNEAFSFKPLEENSHEFRGYIQVSDKLLADDGKPVDLIIGLCDKEIVYSIK